jgi:P4 family phage/plasmid primase-like protien
MFLQKFVNYLNSNGIIFYSKKVVIDDTIDDITKYKRLSCFMKNYNNKLISGADCLVIMTGETKNQGKYIVMIDFDKLHIEENAKFFDEFKNILKNANIDTYHEKTMRDGYHYFFYSNVLYSSSSKIVKDNIEYDIDIRAQGGKSISFGSKFKNMKVKICDTIACTEFELAILPDQLINFLQLKEYNKEKTKTQKQDYSNPSKKLEINDTQIDSTTRDSFEKINPLSTEYDENLDNTFKKVKCILQLLSKANIKFYSTYEEWRNIGFALGTLSIEDKELEQQYLELYISFSAQYKYWNIDNYIMAHNIFYSSNKSITFASLIYKLQKYPDSYKTYINYIVTTKFNNMVRSPTHGSVANYYHSMYPNKYIYDDTNNKWYILLDSNIWELLKDHTRRIRLDIKNNISNIISNKSKNLTNSDIDKELIKKYHKIIDKLNTEDFMKNTFSGLKDYYLQINPKFDQSPYIFTFKNGYCYDLTNSNKIIRKILPEDYITIHTGFDYIEPIKEDIEFIKSFIYSLFENENESQFIIKIISNLLYGNNKYQKCYFFLGIGANGKSLLLTLIEKAFGNYSMKVSSTLFTKPEKDALVSPEIVQCKNKRFLHLSEPNPDDKIQQSRYKSTTGNEKITARSLFSNEIESYVPSFTPFISCNQIPLFEKFDDAIRRRSILIYFKFRFINKLEYSRDRKIDASLHDKINDDKMGLALCHILYNVFEHNFDPSDNLPENSKYIMNEFLSNNDPLHDFLNTNSIIINKDDTNIKISINDLHELYSDFINKEYPDKSVKILPLRKFTELIVSKGFTKTRINYTYILGIKKSIINDDNNLEDSDASNDFEIDM